MSGFRPPKTSIAEKLLLTKRKVPSSPFVFLLIGIFFSVLRCYSLIVCQRNPRPLPTYSATIPAVRLGQTNKFQDATTRVLQNKASEQSNWTPPSTDYVNKALPCQICKIAITDVESLLICDSCEKGTHLKCLQSYSNKGMSKVEWHCPKCLISSNGKPLPPKYGRVTRTPAVPKVPSSMSVAQASTERKSETSDSKINDQIPNGNSTFLVHASTTGSNLGDSVPDLKTDETKEIHDMDFSIQTKMEDGMCSWTNPVIIQKKLLLWNVLS
ncbi:hypothetical protein J5N97_026335 [Dioscorea zingiberensis]|uniref:PHD-type domain-containing protein n=1 Tax=Dioscorea zingiberensis TaxID=325984 RepID=A0A9D5C1Y0_9LILI|nr:hypothetical protein J5N97_026335 [Dioscorea zingiberensis]